MGVDASMFVCNRGARRDAGDLRRLSERLKAELPGPAQWLFEDDFGNSEIKLVRTLGEIRTEWALWEGAPEFCSNNSDYRDSKLRTTNDPDHVQVWEYDQRLHVFPQDEQWIEIDVWARYFGPELLRGPWPDLLAIIEWLEAEFPDGEVWYGGDFSVRHMTPELKAAHCTAWDSPEAKARHGRT